MSLPNQNIPESQKTKSWMSANVAQIVNMSQYGRISKERDIFCYNMYNGNQNDADYNYLRKVGDYEFPAKVRFIPLLRPKLSILLTEETQRPFNFRCYTIDTESVSKKNQAKMDAYLKKMGENKKKISMAYQTALEQFDVFEQQISQARQQAQAEGKPMDPQMEMQLKQMSKEIEIGRFMVTTDNLLNEKDVEEIEKHFKYNYQEFLEVLSEKGIKYCMSTQKLKFVFNRGFEDKLVVDKEYYNVEWTEGKKDPSVRKVSPINFTYAGDSEVQWVDEAEWQMEERYLSIPQIIDEFGDELSYEDMEKLKKRVSYFNAQSGYGYGYYGNSYGFGNGNGTGNPGSVDGCDGGWQGSEDFGNMIRVCKCSWQSPRSVRTKMTPNKYIEGEYHKHIAKEEDVINPDKGEKERVGYQMDVYTGTLLDTNIFVGCKKKSYNRSVDNYWKVSLPVIGMAHNFTTRKPYSLIWAGKDVQILWNLMHYHKELMMAISGAKGFIMDKSQVPEGMSEKEWMYQRKLGVGWVQTIKSGNTRQPTFNQFQSYDDSLSPSIAFVIQVLDHLENLAATVTGVTRARMGQVTSGDQVGTFEQSRVQSGLTTEIIHYEHEQTKQRVLTRLANLLKPAWKEGKTGQFIWGDLAQEMLNVPKNALEGADFAVYAQDSGKDERALQELKQVAFQQQAKGALSMSQLVKMFNTDHLKELEVLAEQYEELAQNRADQGAQNQMNHEKQLKDLDAQLKLQLDKQSGDYQMMATQIEAQKLEFDKMKFGLEMEYKQRADSNKNMTDLAKVSSDENVELQYLDETKRANNMDFTINKAKLILDENTSQQKMSSPSKEKVKD